MTASLAVARAASISIACCCMNDSSYPCNAAYSSIDDDDVENDDFIGPLDPPPPPLRADDEPIMDGPADPSEGSFFCIFCIRGPDPPARPLRP